MVNLLGSLVYNWHNFITIFNTIFIIFFIIYIVCLYFIFKKTYKKGFYAFIPLLNIYHYMDICHVAWYWGFIPIVNIVFFIVSPYLVGYQFGQKEIVKILGILFPFLFFPYIAFSKASYIHPQLISMNINSIDDIDNLEKKIITKIENEEGNTSLSKNTLNNNNKVNSSLQLDKDSLLNQLDSKYTNLVQDDIFVDDVANINVNINEEENNIFKDDEFIELDDYHYDATIESIKNINEIEEKVIINAKEESIDNSEYKEIKEHEKSNEEIAFNQKEVQQLVCPKCGSSLIGATNSCPGCGMDLKLL